MKKTVATFVLLILLSITAFADGDFPFGGKGCPNGQSSCFAPTDSPETKIDVPVYKEISDIIEYLFG